MRRTTGALITAAVLLLAAYGCKGVPEAADAAATDPVARGAYLVAAMGCDDCHTPLKDGPQGPAPDMTRRLSGHPEDLVMPPAPAEQGPWLVAGAATMTAWAGPWGISYAANLTPDEETGMGVWDEPMFAKAMREGRHLGAGRDILPPMPWRNVARLTDDDLKAMFAFLQTLPPIKNHVPEAAIAGQ